MNQALLIFFPDMLTDIYYCTCRGNNISKFTAWSVSTGKHFCFPESMVHKQFMCFVIIVNIDPDCSKVTLKRCRGCLNYINMKTALYWSLNTGSIQALRLLGGSASEITQQGREKLYDYYYNKFRLGQISGIELIEAEGFIPDPNEGWGRDSVYANMTFGQNLGITMVQTATAFSAVVNGGYYRTPFIIKGTMENGELVEKSHTEAIEDKILSDETSAAMRDMLIYNRNYKVRGGIDKPGYAIGGKSGTAQVVRNGAYDDTFAELIGSYIGFVGPEGELPKYVIMVKMWGEGQSIESGDAMNLFDKISNYAINYLKIPPKA